MQNLFSERRHYREYKTESSPDFSDVRAKVEQLEKQSQSRQAKAMDYA
jgi:Spy/CpxP family protein refolding chaperone